jgi:hypothetical protein
MDVGGRVRGGSRARNRVGVLRVRFIPPPFAPETAKADLLGKKRCAITMYLHICAPK